MEHSEQKSDRYNPFCANPLTIPLENYAKECICVCFNQNLAEKECHKPYLLTSSLLSKNATLIYDTKIFLKSIFYQYDYYYLTLVRKSFEMIRLVLAHIFKDILPIFCDIECRSQSNLNSGSKGNPPSLNFCAYQGMTVKL